MTTVSIVSEVLKKLNYLLGGDDHRPDSSKLPPEFETIARDLKSVLEKAKEVLVAADENRKSCDSILEEKKSMAKLLYSCEDALQEIEPKAWNLGRTSSIGSLKSMSTFINRWKTPRDQLQLVNNIKGQIKKLVEKIQHQINKGPIQSTKVLKLPLGPRLEPHVQPKGLLETEKNIRQILTSQDDEDSTGHPIIAIWGIYGKTILVGKLFEDPQIRNYFEGFASVHITHNFDTKKMLQDIILQLCPSEKEMVVKMEDVQLAEKLFRVLKDKKCLVLVDNVWDIKIWRSIRVAFPLDGSKSKILLTTRETVVAAEASSGSGDISYQMMILNEKERLDLLKMAANLDEQSDEMETARKIVGFCGGSALVVSAIGKTLENRSHNEWQELLDALTESHPNYEDENSEGYLVKVLGLSYCGLPHYLKPCFLYLGHFPEDEQIQVETLHLLWMAEGLVPDNDTELMGSTLSYLRDLTAKGLVEKGQEAEAKGEFPHFGTCKLHYLPRELCISRGSEEEFLDVIDFKHGKKTPHAPRLAIHLNQHDQYGQGCNYDKAAIRSLLVFETPDTEPTSSWPEELSDLKDYKSLRILHFNGIGVFAPDLLKGFEKLHYLTYLSFQGCCLDKLPKTVGNLSCLGTLDLRVRGRMMVPDILSELKRLRHLYFPETFALDNTHISLDGLLMLEILENFDTRVCMTTEDLPKLDKLRVLKVIAHGVSKEESEVIIECLQRKTSRLQGSFLDIRDFDCYSEERVAILKSLFSCQAVQFVLQVEGHIGKLPDSNISKSFTQIVLDGSELKTDPMQILEMLPQLKRLVLKNDAFQGKKMTCSASKFPELRNLKLLNMHYLESWIVDKGSMKKLSALTIGKCGKLANFPGELKFLETLKVINITSMPQAFQESVNKEIHTQGRRDFQNPEIVFEN